MMDEPETADEDVTLEDRKAVDTIKPVPSNKRDDPDFFRISSHAVKSGRMLLSPACLYVVWQGLDNARRAKGDFIEIGAQLGGSAFFISQSMQALNLSDRRFYVISKFRATREHPKGAVKEGPHEARFEDVRDLLHRFPNTEVRQGTVEDATRGMKVEHYAFAHINLSGHYSTTAALGHVFNRLSPGGVIVLSQFNTIKRESVKEAVRDYLKGRTDYWLFRLPTMQALLMRV
jgi:hypothetical protein